jgi:hypothetical protein
METVTVTEHGEFESFIAMGISSDRIVETSRLRSSTGFRNRQDSTRACVKPGTQTDTQTVGVQQRAAQQSHRVKSPV